MAEKSYSIIQYLLLIFACIETSWFLPGVLKATLLKAEIKPVEPEQGNSCEGKVSNILLPSPVCISLFPNLFNR